MKKAYEILSDIDGLTILGKANVTVSPLSFTIKDIHPHDLTDILGEKGICLRAGHHCAQPLHKRLGVTASSRMSVGLYNTFEEIALLPKAIQNAQKILCGPPTH